jgi:hypothetical protein
MADEQTPNSDLIEDALRQAERQLEERLEALRMSALGEPTPSATPADDVAILRPTGGASESNDDADDASGDAFSWGERSDASGDLTFQPVGILDDEEFAAPRTLDEEQADEDAGDSSLGSWAAPSPSPSTASASSQDTDDDSVDAAPISTSPAHPVSRATDAWTSGTTAPSRRTPSLPTTSAPMSSAPTEDELQFWAHTRTALRNLQQVTDTMPSQITETVTEDVERIVHDEIATATAQIRLLQQSMQQGLPKLVDRVEGQLEQGLAGPNAALRQLRDELPQQVDRGNRDLRAALREDLDRSAGASHGAMQKDITQLEQSIAANVTRMAQTIGDGVGGVERDVEQLGETLTRFDRGMRSEFDRVETQLRGSIDRVEESMREELVEPTEIARKLDEEMPARFGRIERAFTEQLQSTQRDMSGILSTLVDVNRASLERVTAIAGALDEERSRRAEDTELVVDTVTSGWEGLAGAMKALYQQNEQIDRRIDAIEKRLAKLRDVEKAVDGTLQEFKEQVADLAPAPVVVTVSHPDASVQNTSRSGWVPERQLEAASQKSKKK